VFPEFSSSRFADTSVIGLEVVIGKVPLVNNPLRAPQLHGDNLDGD
jgi:hypothetical protein